MALMHNTEQHIAEKKDLIGKITIFLAGFLAAILVITTFLKLTQNYWGLIIALLICGVYSFFVLKKKIVKQKLLAIGVLTATIVTIVAAVLIFSSLLIAFQGIAN